MRPRWGSTPRLTDWLTVSRNVTLTLSRRRRRKWKSQIWDSKIWSQVPRDSDSRKMALERASSMYKRQTCPLVREGAPQKQDSNCQRVINIWSWTPNGVDTKTYWLTDRPSVAIWLRLWPRQLAVSGWQFPSECQTLRTDQQWNKWRKQAKWNHVYRRIQEVCLWGCKVRMDDFMWNNYV
jgi:hypothetical protein